MSGASGTAYFATCITFFVDENHVARLPPKPLPVHTALPRSRASISGICSHGIVSLPVISGNQLSQLACYRVHCPFIQHSHIPMGRSHPSVSGICSHTVCFGGCVCLSAQPPIIFGNTLPHNMVSHILGSAGFRILCLFINTATAHHYISLSQMSV